MQRAGMLRGPERIDSKREGVAILVTLLCSSEKNFADGGRYSAQGCQGSVKVAGFSARLTAFIRAASFVYVRRRLTRNTSRATQTGTCQIRPDPLPGSKARTCLARGQFHRYGCGRRAKMYARRLWCSTSGYGSRSMISSISKPTSRRTVAISSVRKKRKSTLTCCPHHSSR